MECFYKEHAIVGSIAHVQLRDSARPGLARLGDTSNVIKLARVCIVG